MAAVLTCDQFQARLAEALGTLPGQDRPVPVFAAKPTGRTIAWSGVPGLSGRLTCGDAGAFADFYMVVDPGLRGPSALVPGFVALAAASVCALSAGTPEACLAVATTMTTDGLDQVKEDLAQHDDQPQSLQDYDLAPDLDAVFYVTPAAISWAIGPGLYATLATERQPLEPEDRDKDD